MSRPTNCLRGQICLRRCKSLCARAFSSLRCGKTPNRRRQVRRRKSARWISTAVPPCGEVLSLTPHGTRSGQIRSSPYRTRPRRRICMACPDSSLSCQGESFSPGFSGRWFLTFGRAWVFPPVVLAPADISGMAHSPRGKLPVSSTRSVWIIKSFSR